MDCYPKFAHTAIITGATGCGKTEYVMGLLTTVYKNFFDAVIVICPTFLDNSTYQRYRPLFDRKQFYDGVTDFYWWNLKGALNFLNRRYPTKRGVSLCDSIRCWREQFREYGRLLFIVDDLAADVETSRKNTEISKLAVSGRHTDHSLWVLTQKYNMIAKEVRSQAMFVTSFYTKDRRSFDDMLAENWTGNVDREGLYGQLMSGRYSYVCLKLFYPFGMYIYEGS